jgi:WD40 repeat protein
MRRFRFSLRTLVCFALLCGSGVALWMNAAAWYIVRSVPGVANDFGGGSVISSDSQLIVYWSIDPNHVGDIPAPVPIPYSQELNVFESGMGQKLTSLIGIPSSVWHVSISPDHGQIFAIGADGAFLWDLSKGGVPYRIKREKQNRCGFSAKGTYLMLWTVDSTPLVSDLCFFENSGALKKLPSEALPEWSMQILDSPDERFLAAIDAQAKRIVVLDLRSMYVVKTLDLPTELIAAGTFTPDSRELWIKSYTEMTLAFDTKEWKEIRHSLTGDNFWSEAQWLPDGSRCIMCSSGRAEIMDREFKRCGQFPSFLSPLTVSPDSQRIITARYDNGVQTFVDVRDRNGTELGTFLRREKSEYLDILKCIDNERIVATDLHKFHILARRRPEPWWGIAWLPEFWVTLICSFSFAWSVWRELSIKSGAS